MCAGHYKAEELNQQTSTYEVHAGVGVHITVEETFDNDHRVVSQKGDSDGKFTFTAADSGDHRICFALTNAGVGSGWLSSGQPPNGIKFTLDMAIGATSTIESTDKSKLDDIVQKVKDLNGRLQDIRREQVFQRVGVCDPDNHPHIQH